MLIYIISVVKLIRSTVSHTDSVTSLIAKDFTLVSGGHDGSLRVWDIRKMQLLYEVPVSFLMPSQIPIVSPKEV
jgi:WD40 repeat protein